MLISQINDFCTKRVNLAGAFYLTFGIFGLINYPLSYLFYLYYNENFSCESLLLRLVATILCFFLSIHKFWPIKIKKYLPLYWHFTLFFCLPFIGTYLLFYNHLSLSWLMNMVLAFFLLILVVDWISFLILIALGAMLGLLAYVVSGGSLTLEVKEEYLSMAIYMYLFAIIIGAIFSRNKELLEIERAQTTEIIKSLNKDLEDKIRERTSDLQKALSTKTEFLNNMSHEIRTPVHGFTAISEGLVDLWSSLGDDKKYKYVVEIANNASRLGNLLTDLLDMSKFTANKMSISLKKVNLNELVDAVVTECNELYLKDKPINMIFNSSKKNIVNVDKSKIEQVLRNLLTNSIKFTPENGNIEIIIKSQPKLTKVTIVDSGVGIPEKELKEIFEVFTQSSKTKTNAGGTGLGLSISKNIVELHKGKIWASNNDGGGSSFCFTIPKVKEDN